MTEQQQPQNGKAKYRTLLLDMDGVLAEVSKSYRKAIEMTCHTYGATSVTQQTITEWKARGNANDDWILSYNLILNDPNGQKENLTLEQVTETFENFYQGTSDQPGLCELETLIPSIETLQELYKRCTKAGSKMGIVTGRPRADCMTFLKLQNIEHYFDACYCMEDGPSKPDPYPVIRCCELLNVQPDSSVVLVGDTPDDIEAAVKAGCSGVGVVTPEAYDEQIKNNESYTLAPLAIIMKENRGADCIFPPGFADLVHLFPEC